LRSRPPPDGDAAKTQSLGRRRCTVKGRRSCDKRRRELIFVQLSFADLQEGGDHPADHPPKEGIGADVDRHEPAVPPDPDRMHGPDRLAVR
jgi:hypothetical protein